MKPPVIVALAVAVSACASLEPAKMAMAPQLMATTEQISVSGIGGGTRGSYRAGESSGQFTRSESRLVVFDMVDTRYGGATFTLSEPSIEGQIEARCTVRERSINLGENVSFTPQRMAYGCDFTINGRPFPARFEIQEARSGLAGALMKRERRGEIALDREILQIRSVHNLEGSPLQTATPIGYVFEQNGRQVGAVELNGTPRMFLPPNGADPSLRRAVVAGSMALALLWDPADSAL